MLVRRAFPVVVGIGLLGLMGAAAAQQPIAIATPPAGSVYNSSGSAIAKVLADKGLKVTIQAFGGSSQYLPAINAGELEFGIANVYETALAVQGQDYFKGRPTTNVRTVATIFPLRNSIFVRKDSPFKNVADLKGKRGPTGFTSQRVLVAVTNAVLGTAGLTLEKDIQGVNVANIIGNTDAFTANRTDFFVFALGAAKVKEVDAAVGGVRALPIPNTPDAIAGMRKHVPGAFLRREVPNPVSTGIMEPTYQVAYGVNVFASTKTSNDLVYKMVEAIHANAKELGQAVGVLRLLDPNGMAVVIPGVEYHPGAIEFYKKIGQWPPKTL